jgi:two-component system cell cycle sensor histidine kinase/response regulator CckA
VLRPRPLDLAALLARLDRMLRRLIGEHIDVITRVPPEVPCALADEGQLEQLIVNVALNGRDAMPRGGKLHFSVGEAILAEAEARRRALAPGRYVVLSVGDTGAGMEAETLSHIFEPFFTTKQPGQGTGLGLSTAYGFVRQSGGDIEVESTPGHGTTFRIYLPATEQRAAAAQEVVDGHPLIGNEVVLVAEDEAMVLHLATELLRRAGYHVVGAQSAAEALDIASRPQAIDLLLTDVFLGDLSGQELAARIASARPTLRTVYMSGYSAEEVPEPIVQKPFAAASLLRAVRNALDNGDSPALDGP